MIRSYFLLVFTILAATNCFSKTDYTFHQDPLLVTLVSIHHPNCSDPLGKITVLATGGTPAYTYLWSTGATGASLTGLPAGDYKVTATDGDGSMAELGILLVDDFVAPLADAGSPKMVSCSNTLTTLSGSGSSGPGFSQQWVASNGGHILSGANTYSPVVDLAGSFQLTVTDLDNGCTTTDATTVTAQFTAPSAQATGGVINCTSSSVTLSAVYTVLHTTFKWQGPGGFNSNLLNPTVSVAGNYVFTVTDTLTGCINKSTAAVTTNITAPNVGVSGGGTITCAQLSVELFGTSTTPAVIYSWAGPNGYSSVEQNPVVTAAGTYTLTVRNPVNGCTATAPISVASNLVVPIPTAAVNGTLTCIVQMVLLSGSSNTPGVSYSWTGPNNYSSSIQNPSVSAPGQYFLTIKNPVNGCTGITSVTVLQNIVPPNASATGGVKTCSVPNVTLTGSSTTQGATYSWTGPNNFSSNLQNPVVSNTGNYTLKVTNPTNGCTATATANVSQNTTAPSVSATSGTITCTNPLAKITTTSNPQGLMFSWSGPNNFVSSQQNPMVGVGGYYYVTATNPANGCINTSSVYTFENTTPPFAYAGEDKSLNCYFSSILINASFSSNGPNYTYAWTTFDGNIVSGANSLYPSVNLEGTYTLKVTNTTNGCMDLDSMMVTQSTPVTSVISQVSPVYCSGGSNGSATVSAGGGNGFYSYKWSNGKLTATATGLAAGVYTVTVTDSEGCSATSSATINQLVLSATVNVTHQTIPAVNNGTANIIGSGGTGPYTAKWSNGAMTLSINNLAPGTYSVTLTDAQGCTLVKTTNINAANCTLAGTVAATNVTCFGANNGTATVNLTGATNPITYVWSNGSTAKTANALAPGTYTATATDASGCLVVLSTQITSPSQLVTTLISKTDVRCPNAGDGAISVGVTGGTQPYNYVWSNNATNASISGLAPGNYILTVTDSKTCINTLSAAINSPSQIVISVIEKTDVPCPGGNTGSVAISVSGGLPPYHYFWSNGSTVSAISGLTPGNYTLTVTDENDCPKSLSTQIMVLDQTPPTLHLKNATVELDNNGAVSVSAMLFDNGSVDNCGIATWAVTPNTFNCEQIGQNTVTITVTDPGGNISSATAILTVVDNFAPTVICPANITEGTCTSTVQFALPQVIDNCQPNPSQLVRLSGLPSGSVFPAGTTHQIYRYTDPSGNVGQCEFTITIGAPVSLTLTSTDATCSNACDGTATLTQNSGGSFNLLWSNGQTGQNLTGLCPGNYTAIITDAYNCIQSETASVIVKDLEAPVLTCPGNISTGFCTGPIFYNQPLVTDNCTVNPASVQLVSGLASGALFPVGNTVQTFSYTDGGGNTGQCSFSVSIAGPATINTAAQAVTCSGLCNGSATITASGGSGPFNIQWSNGQNGSIANGLCAGNYTYTIIDILGCTQSGSVSITEPLPLLMTVMQVLNDPGNSGNGSIQVNISGGTPGYFYNWTRNAVYFANTEDLNNLFAGQYVGVVTDSKGCTKSSGPVAISNAVSTKAPDLNKSFTIAPNPASEVVNLDFGKPLDQVAELSILDLNGQRVYLQSLLGTEQKVSIDVSSFAAGMWMIRLQLKDGQVAVRKLVVVK